MLRGAGLTGAADSKTGIFSCWFRLDGGDGAQQTILSAAGNNLQVIKTGANTITIRCTDTAAATAMSISTAGTFLAGPKWHHIVASWNVATAGQRWIYIDGVSDLVENIFTNVTLDYTHADWGIGAETAAGNKFNGCLSDVYFQAGEVIDLSVAANLAKFITTTGRTVDLGATGSNPTGTQPIVFQSITYADAATVFATNKGSGGNFSITGTLDLATSIPELYNFGSASTPADGAATTNTADPTAVTPPTGMLEGDLVFLVGHKRLATGTLTISQAGGQSWTTLFGTDIHTTVTTGQVFAATFDGGNVGSALFDGTNDYMTRGAGLTGAADSKSGIFSCWVSLTGDSGRILGGVTTLGGSVERIVLRIATDKTLVISGYNSAGTSILQMTSVAIDFTRPVHILASWNLATAGTGRIYINDVSSYNETTYTNDTIDYTLADWGIGARSDGVNIFNGPLSELYFAPGQYLDFSTESNRRKFVTADLRAVELGAGGATPTGTQPLVYQRRLPSAAASTFATNAGTGGNFTITGSLTNGDNVPFSGWSENPSIAFGATTCNSAYMHVFRPPSTSYTWGVDVAAVELDDTSDPFTITGQTTTGTNPTVTFAGWLTGDDNEWGTLTGTGWGVTGGAQYRNTSGSDQSASFAHKIQTAAAATGNVSKSQTTLGPNDTTTFIVTMEAIRPRYREPVNRSFAVVRAAGY